MSRALLTATLCLVCLGGCELLQPQTSPSARPPDPRVQAYGEIRGWLDMGQQISAMDTEQVVEQLVLLGKPEGPDAQYRFGLLNQKLKTYASWVQARDAFRVVVEDPTVTREQRQLAAVLLQYNQSRINWYLEYRKVQEELAGTQSDLAATREENALLQQKIQAITELETSISTRKEQ